MKNLKLNIEKNKKGFTLIELLVVISIIGVLAALATISFGSSQKQARDTKRKSDLKMFQNALENYANKNKGFYPMYSSGTVISSTVCDWLDISGTCPNDPKYDPSDASSPQYHYRTDGTLNNATATATQYVLWSVLENTTGYWVVCSTGSVFSTTSQPNISSCQ